MTPVLFTPDMKGPLWDAHLFIPNLIPRKKPRDRLSRPIRKKGRGRQIWPNKSWKQNSAVSRQSSACLKRNCRMSPRRNIRAMLICLRRHLKMKRCLRRSLPSYWTVSSPNLSGLRKARPCKIGCGGRGPLSLIRRNGLCRSI